MYKYWIILLCLLIAASMFAGCQKQADPGQTPTPLPYPSDPNLPNEEVFIARTNDPSLLEEYLLVKRAYDALSSTRGFIWFEGPDGKAHILILMGEKPSGGYSLEVVSHEKDGDILRIIVLEKVPGLNQNVTTALTYPFQFLVVNMLPERVYVENTEGQAYPNLVLPGLTAATGKYTGQIDANSVEIRIDAGFDFKESGTHHAFRLDVLSREYFNADSPYYKKIADNTPIHFLFYVNKHNQYVLADLFQQK